MSEFRIKVRATGYRSLLRKRPEFKVVVSLAGAAASEWVYDLDPGGPRVARAVARLKREVRERHAASVEWREPA